MVCWRETETGGGNLCQVFEIFVNNQTMTTTVIQSSDFKTQVGIEGWWRGPDFMCHSLQQTCVCVCVSVCMCECVSV